MNWLYALAAILLLVIAWQAVPSVGGPLLALVVIVMLSNAYNKGYI